MSEAVLPEEIAAAEEIARVGDWHIQNVPVIREEVERYAAIIATHRTELVARLVAENARLRAALKRALKTLEECRDDTTGTPSEAIFEDDAEACRAALQPAPAVNRLLAKLREVQDGN